MLTEQRTVKLNTFGSLAAKKPFAAFVGCPHGAFVTTADHLTVSLLHTHRRIEAQVEGREMMLEGTTKRKEFLLKFLGFVPNSKYFLLTCKFSAKCIEKMLEIFIFIPTVCQNWLQMLKKFFLCADISCLF